MLSLSEMAGTGKEEEHAIVEEDEKVTNDDQGNGATADQESSDKLVRLPLTRIKHIMKADPDVTLSSQEAVVMLAKATELFVHMLSADAVTHTVQGKRKTLQRKDLDNILDAKDCYSFLEARISTAFLSGAASLRQLIEDTQRAPSHYTDTGSTSRCSNLYC